MTHIMLYYHSTASSAMDIVLDSKAVSLGLDKTKDIDIGICCFSAKYAAFMNKGQDLSAKSQNNVSG